MEPFGQTYPPPQGTGLLSMVVPPTGVPPRVIKTGVEADVKLPQATIHLK